jgi:hypothetical protein
LGTLFLIIEKCGGVLMLSRNLRLVSCGLFTAAALVAGSCGKKKSSDSGDDKNQSAAQFSLSGQLAISSSLNFAGASSPDTIYAIPANTIENIYSFRKESLKTINVGADGKFAASVDANQGDVLFVAFDSKAANRMDGIRGVLSVKDDSGSLMRIPAQDGKTAVDLGTMTSDSAGKEFVSGKKTDDVQSSFSLDLAKMKELARTDDSSRQLINVAANIRDNGDFFFAKPYMVFNGKSSSIKNTFSQITDSKYNGYGLYFVARWNGVKAEDFCNGASAAHKLKLIPPTNVKPAMCNDNACNTKTDFIVLTNESTGSLQSEGGNRSSCYSPMQGNQPPADGGFYIAKETRDGFEPPMGFNWGGGGYNGAMPSGVWVLQLDGSEVGRYDLKSADPVNADGKIVIYAPSIKATVDGSNKVSKVEIEWYLWNAATGAYDKVTDPSSFARNAKEVGVEIADYSGGCSSGKSTFQQVANLSTFPLSVDVSSFGAAFPPTDGSTTSNSGSVCESESIALSYSLNGVTYRFDFRPYYNNL